MSKVYPLEVNNPMHPPEVRPHEEDTNGVPSPEVDTSKMTAMNKIYVMIHGKDPAKREKGKELFSIDDRYVFRYGKLFNGEKIRAEINKQVEEFIEGKNIEAEEKKKFFENVMEVSNKEKISPSQLLLERMANDNGLKPEQKTFLFNINYNSNLGKPFLPQTLLHAATRNCDEEMVNILLRLGKWLAPSLLAHFVYNEELKNKNYPNMDAAYSTYCFMPGKTGRIQKKIREKMKELDIPYTISTGSSISVLRMGGKSKHKRKTTNKTTKKQRKTSKKLRKTK